MEWSQARRARNFNLSLDRAQSRVCLLRNQGDHDCRQGKDVQMGVVWEWSGSGRTTGTREMNTSSGVLEGNIPSASTAASHVIADSEDGSASRTSFCSISRPVGISCW